MLWHIPYYEKKITMESFKGRVVLDLDDLASDSESNAMDILFELKDRYPKFKVTLFTILGRWRNKELLKQIGKIKWVELAAHGYTHMTNAEVADWDKKKWYDVINEYENMGCFVQGFKAPNWEMSPLGYEVLKDCGWWVAVRSHQIPDVPVGAQYYCFETNLFGAHGHTWTLKPDLKDGRFMFSQSTNFSFVSRNIETKK